jgi:Predicted membrane protein (DUF2079)
MSISAKEMDTCDCDKRAWTRPKPDDRLPVGRYPLVRTGKIDKEPGKFSELFRPAWAFGLSVVAAAGFFALFFLLAFAKMRNYDVLIFDLENFSWGWGEIKDFFAGRISSPILVHLILNPLLALPLIPNAIRASNLWAAGFTTLFAALSIPALYLLGRQVIGSAYWALALAFSFAIHPLINSYAMIGYQPGPAMTFFFFFEILFLARRRLGWFTFFLVMANLARFNAIEMNFLLGFALCLSASTRRYGLRAMVLSLVWAGLAIYLVRWNGRAAGLEFSSEMAHINAFGEDFVSAAKNVIADPMLLARNLFIAENLHHLLSLTPLLLILPLFAPVIAFSGAMEFAYVMLTSSSLDLVPWMTNLKQAAPGRVFFNNAMIGVIAAAYAASAFGLRLLLTRIDPRRALVLGFAILFATVNLFHHYAHANVSFGPVPLSKGFSTNYYKKSPHAEVIDKAWSFVPDGERVKAMQQLNGFQGPRMQVVYHFYSLEEGRGYDWVLFDLFGFSHMVPRETFLGNARHFLQGEAFGVLFFEDGVVLLKRGAPIVENPPVLDFMDKNAELVSKNHLNPYVLGSEPGEYYSKTQLVE